MASVRLPAVYGPLERPSSSRPGTSTMHRLMEALRHRRPVTVAGPQVGRDWTYVADAGAAIAQLLVAPSWHYSVYNVSCGHRYTFAAVVAAFAAHGLQATWVNVGPARRRRHVQGARTPAAGYPAFAQGYALHPPLHPGSRNCGLARRRATALAAIPDPCLPFAPASSSLLPYYFPKTFITFSQPSATIKTCCAGEPITTAASRQVQRGKYFDSDCELWEDFVCHVNDLL